MLFLHLGFYFLIFSFFGWVLEVGFHAVKAHEFVNRGFNNGPVCPIYGFGIALLYLTLGGLRERWLLLYLFSVLLTSAIELSTGFLLDRLFHTKWWDYSGERLNLGGYICLKFSLIWGVFCTAVVKLLFNPLDALFAVMPLWLLLALEILCFLLLLCDVTLSVLKVIGFNRELALLDKLAVAIRSGSDKIGQTVANGTIKAEEEYRKLQEKTAALYERLLDAFPSMRSTRYNEQLTELKSRRAARKAARRAKRAARANADETSAD